MLAQEVMADALAGLDRSHKLPKSVRVVPVVAPIEILRGKTASGEVSVSSVAHASASFVARLHDQTGTPIPHNVIPSLVAVEGIDVVPAQFLRLMAEALVAPSPETKLHIKKVEMFSGVDEMFYRTRIERDLGGLWTRKPAVLVAVGAGGEAGQ
jgi:hypothetical protein